MQDANVFVLEAADELLSLGFNDKIDSAFKKLKAGCQVLAFSATLPDAVKQLTRHMYNPLTIQETIRSDLSLKSVSHFFVKFESVAYKKEELFDMYEVMTIEQAVIFSRPYSTVQGLTREMKKASHTISIFWSVISLNFSLFV
jgi:ATP-dependent RNA helicase DeaD